MFGFEIKDATSYYVWWTQ